jgi:hypothetical protein
LEKISSKIPSRREFGFMLDESFFGSFCPPEVLDPEIWWKFQRINF